ncbi:MAG: L-aspartate oxidase [Clostridiales bacterium]|nr:L-aspartate oxidase [Clostridiales bacterium]
MKRYIADLNISDITVLQTDVAIVGSGLAGLYAAYNLDPALQCILFTKQDVDDSSSNLAQGGIAAVTEKDDRIEYHFNDTITAGAGLCDPEAVQVIVEEGPRDIESLIELGVNFDMDKKGHLLTAQEGGHRMRRILRCGGDATGAEIVEKLRVSVSLLDNVEMQEDTFVADVLTDASGVYGILVQQENAWYVYLTNQVIIATGGIGQVYRYTTNPSVATADGIALSQRAGAQLNDMEFVQFHPTGLYTIENRNKQCFLISEAVRGEGATLHNDADERFMVGRHEMSELAPRDIVAREIFIEIKRQKSPYVKLDITHQSQEFLKERFPTIYAECLKHGIEMSKDVIPVGPVQHYFMGGIKTDLHGTTNIKGLYAIGEAANTGVHGANRLASNSTLECVVFGRRCAKYISENYTKRNAGLSYPNIKHQSHAIDVEKEIIDLKGIMIKYCGIIRSKYCLKTFALPHTESLLNKLEDVSLDTIREMELYNMAQTAHEIVRSALDRDESVGSHFREEKRLC